ncbi:MAG: hypothetical protein QOH39_845 [Verrucomicrobiota bacterium]|jgi:hypothetical protein
MYLVELDRSKRLLVISASGDVTSDEVKETARKIRELIKDAAPGIRVLTDLRWLNSMQPSAAAHIADIMDALSEKRLASVTRIVPDPGKDIGFNILSQFHYHPPVPIFTFETMADAIENLRLADDIQGNLETDVTREGA